MIQLQNMQLQSAYVNLFKMESCTRDKIDKTFSAFRISLDALSK